MATLLIDKSNWELVKLGDVAHEVRESLTKSNIQVDRSVGLEHIEPGDLHIRSWDELDESSSFTKVFREGHVLFGRRRAYLKKAALADFNGVCSGDITVISASEDLLPSLLPFVVSSDRFFAFAVEHSAGGLSPRVKWKDLANYEFPLPPKDQQAEIAELLWAIDKYEIELNRTRICVEQMFVVRRRALLLEACASNCRCLPLNEFGTFHGGLSGKSKKDFGVTGERYVTYTNVYDNEAVDFSRVDLVAIDPGEKQFALAFGDVIFTGSSETRDEVGMSSVVTEQPIGSVYLNSFCFVFRPRSVAELLPSFSKYYFRSDYVRKFMFQHGQGSTRYNLSKKTTGKKLMLSIPDVERQKHVVSELDSVRDSLRKIEQLSLDCENVRTALVNSLLV